MMSSKILGCCKPTILSRCKNILRGIREASRQTNKYYSSNCEKKPSTVAEIVKHWSHRFENEGISEPVESIEHILAHILGTRKIMDLANIPEQQLSDDQVSKLLALCECRMSRMPVQYIIGEWDFRDITLKMIPPVFIPRPETEILVDIVLRRIAAMKTECCKILDIGCGSGAISLALVHANNKIKCTAIDRSLYACHLTKQNAEALGLQDNMEILNAILRENGDIKLLNTVEKAPKIEEEQFDIIVSNPPYIPTGKLPDLAPEIKIYEDLRALDGGKDGLNTIKALMKYASKALVPSGLLFMEVDHLHPEYIEFFAKKYSELNLLHEHTYKDYCCNDRFVELSKLQ